jgi:hypothetical protein
MDNNFDFIKKVALRLKNEEIDKMSEEQKTRIIEIDSEINEIEEKESYMQYILDLLEKYMF